MLEIIFWLCKKTADAADNFDDNLGTTTYLGQIRSAAECNFVNRSTIYGDT